MRRRDFLKVVGGSGLILAAGIGGYLTNRVPDTALAPWEKAGAGYADPLRRALSYALLAPNPHNRQPWLIDVISETEGVLYCDLDRRLPATDPYDRQTVIGLGCFLELFDQAAKQDGHAAQINLFPKGMPPGDIHGRLDQRPIAHLKLIKSSETAPDPLFTHCLNRHTDRFAYDPDRPVSEEDKILIQNAGLVPFANRADGTVQFIDQDPLLQDIQTLTADCMIIEADNREAHMESVNLMRIGADEINRNPDGLSLYGPMLEGMHLIGILNREAMADPDSVIFRGGMDPMLEAMASTPSFVWIGTATNDRLAQIAAGRSFMRTCLAATSVGLAVHPVSQALQEYADMDEQYDRLHDLLEYGGSERLQMLARIGYGDQGKPSPRWPLEEKLRS